LESLLAAVVVVVTFVLPRSLCVRFGSMGATTAMVETDVVVAVESMVGLVFVVFVLDAAVAAAAVVTVVGGGGGGSGIGI
jgi:hypothetical protein